VKLLGDFAGVKLHHSDLAVLQVEVMWRGLLPTVKCLLVPPVPPLLVHLSQKLTGKCIDTRSEEE
jgi:hypothetical protein